MDTHYDDLFNIRNVYYQRIIPSVGIAILRKVLDKDLDIINNLNLNMKECKQFKSQMLNYEVQWGIEIFRFSTDVMNIDIIWDNLQNKPTRYYQVYMALQIYMPFQGDWIGDKQLSDMWAVIDDYQKRSL